MLSLAAGLSCLASLRAAVPGPTGLPNGDSPPPAAQKMEVTVVSITARRAALQAEIATTREELANFPEGVSADAARWLTQETALLERIDAVHAEQQRTWQHAADLALEAADVQERTRNRRPAEATFKPPYDLALLDELYAERDYLDQATDALKRDVANAETDFREARDILEEKNRDRRAVRGTSDAKEAAGKAPGNLRLAELESRLAQETLLLREKALKTLKLQQSLLEPKKKLLRPRLEWLREHLTLGTEPAPIAQEKRAAELDLAIDSAKAEAEAATQLVIAAERRATPGKASAELEACRANRQTANLALSVLTAQRERLAEKVNVTALRRRVLSGEMSTAEMRALAEENKTVVAQLVRERRRTLTEVIKSRRELQDWQSRLTQATTAGEAASPWIVDRVKRLPAWMELGQTEMAELDRLRIERSRLQEEIGTRVNLFSLRDATAIGRENMVAA